MAGELAALMVEERAIGKVVRGLERAVAKSFLDDGSRMTTSEVKRRTALCLDGFKQFRSDLKWSVERCLNELSRYLRHKLDGVPWTPDTARAVWSPEEDDSTPRSPGGIILSS